MSLSWVHAEEEVKQFSQGPSRPCSEVREPRHQPGYSPPHGTIGQRPWQPASLSRRAGAQRATSPISRADLAEHGHHQASSLPHHEGGMATSCPQPHVPPTIKCHCKTFTWRPFTRWLRPLAVGTAPSRRTRPPLLLARVFSLPGNDKERQRP